ncbi:QRFP-like peptide receptor [Dendronephthya gigantea]|uniref:QRFP-like peptide receptor n=1 Tax=Dendronephthya gigantea TaxID=151771 RepID=UPI00106D894C|nr:QRFP-like peptide receptor [Dendronephthya gigantea]XP_028402075.1 QRFP-like peptide receptor [Dendronephthya gigantea]
MTLAEADSYHTWGDGKMVVLAYTTIITIGGLLGNTLVIFLFINYKSLRTVTNNFIINLAACNLALAMLELVFSLPALFASDWVFGEVLAALYAFSYFLLVSVSMVMLAVIAIDRYHVISRPKGRAPISGTKSLLVILVVYVYTLAIASPVLYAPTGLKVKMYISGCYVDFTPSSNFGSGSYSIVILTLLYIVPLVTMVHYYWKIFMVLQNRRQGSVSGRGKLGNGRSSEDTTRVKSGKDNTRVKTRVTSFEDNTRVRPASTYTMRNTPVKTLRVIVMLVAFFLVTWTPFMICTLCRAFNRREIFNDKAKEIIILLTKSVIIINPVAYAMVNHRFQKCVAKLFCGAQVIIGATTCTENSIDFHFSRNARGSAHECHRSSRGSAQESRKSRFPSRLSRLSSTPDVFISESFTPARQSTLRHSYSDSQLEKHACIEGSIGEAEEEHRCRRNTDRDKFLKLGIDDTKKTSRNWDIYVTSF